MLRRKNFCCIHQWQHEAGSVRWSFAWGKFSWIFRIQNKLLNNKMTWEAELNKTVCMLEASWDSNNSNLFCCSPPVYNIWSTLLKARLGRFILQRNLFFFPALLFTFRFFFLRCSCIFLGFWNFCLSQVKYLLPSVCSISSHMTS